MPYVTNIILLTRLVGGDIKPAVSFRGLKHSHLIQLLFFSSYHLKDLAMKVKSLFNPHFIITAFLLGCITLLSTGSSSRNISPQQTLRLEDIKRENKTRALEVTKLEITPTFGDHLAQVTFTNTYDKAITAFVVTTGIYTPHSKSTITEDFAANENAYIRPGKSYTNFFSVGEMREAGITILAVMFEDGTGEGDADEVREIIETRTGKAKVYNYFLPKIREMLDSADDNQKQEGLESLKAQIRDFPRDNNGKAYIESGISDGKLELLSQIRDYEFRPKTSLRDVLNILEKYCWEVPPRLKGRPPETSNQRF